MTPRGLDATYCFNTSPLNYFAKCGRLDLLIERYRSNAFVPEELTVDEAWTLHTQMVAEGFWSPVREIEELRRLVGNASN